MALNVELFRKVQEAITREAKTFDMNCFAHMKYDGWQWYCDSPACLAGWAVALSVPDSEFRRLRERDIRGRATELLDPPSGMFYVDRWPYRFRRRYKRAVRPATRARVACDYIDYLIEQEARRATQPGFMDYEIESEYEDLLTLPGEQES
jgi:hypothetical protein